MVIFVLTKPFHKFEVFFVKRIVTFRSNFERSYVMLNQNLSIYQDTKGLLMKHIDVI
jgi:hypothetical protein